MLLPISRLVRTHLSTLRSGFACWPGHFDEARRVSYCRYTETPLRLVHKEGKTLFAFVHAVEDPCDTRHGPASHNFMCQTSWYSVGTRSGLLCACFGRPPYGGSCNFGVFNRDIHASMILPRCTGRRVLPASTGKLVSGSLLRLVPSQAGGWVGRREAWAAAFHAADSTPPYRIASAGHTATSGTATQTAGQRRREQAWRA